MLFVSLELVVGKEKEPRQVRLFLFWMRFGMRTKPG